jgi:hypothetical protein
VDVVQVAMDVTKRRPAYELHFSMIAILALTGLYVYVARDGVPQPGGLIGHGLGIVGFLLMLCAETLYTLRKRLRRFTLGSTHTWLQLHVFTGLVGPYLVLLHTAGRFHGLAGLVTLLTVLMVVSGFVGRYLYTAAPRGLDGAEVGIQELEAQIAGADRQLKELGVEAGTTGLAAWMNEDPPRGWRSVLGRHLLQWRYRRRLRRWLRQEQQAGHSQAASLEPLLVRRYRLWMQIHSLAVTRRLLSLWHLFHVPLGAVLFLLAFLHIGAALYYGTFSK